MKIDMGEQLSTNLLTQKIQENLCKVSIIVSNIACVAHPGPVHFWPGHLIMISIEFLVKITKILLHEQSLVKITKNKKYHTNGHSLKFP